jgi:membrane-associated phospholipid phosphatase
MPLILLLLVAAASAALTAAVVARYPHAAAGDATAGAVEEVVEEAVEHSAAARTWLERRRDPTVATGLALSVALLVAIGGGLLLAVLAALVRSFDVLLDLDAGTARFGHAHASHWSTRGLELVTQLGETHTVVALGVVVGVVEVARTRRAAIVPFLVLVVAGDSAVTNAVKSLVDRARPTLNPVAHTLGPSFPSGHSSTAAAFYAACALLLGRGRGPRTRTALAAVAVGIAVAVAASRVLLDVHWLSDVVGGLALGFAWFSVCAIAFGGRLMRFGAPVEVAESEARRADAGEREPADVGAGHV